MPSTYRSNISWKTKEEHDEAMEYCEKKGEKLSEHIQKHFKSVTRRRK